MDATLTIQLPTHAGYGSWVSDDWRRLLDLARAAEAAGIDRVAAVDHVVMGRDTAQYTWAAMNVPPEAPWLEPLALLSAIAAVTETVRLSTRILIAPLRPAPLLAKTAASLDALSGGRLDLGVGTGWQREEYEAQGLDFGDRGRLLTGTIAACRALWEQLPASYAGPTTAFADVFCSPQPRGGRLPVWFGGTLHRRNLERIVTLGDGWIPIMQAGLDAVRTGAAALRRAAPDRSFDVQGELPVVRREGGGVDLAATVEQAPDFLAAGATDIFVSLAAVCPDPERAPAALAELGKRFRSVTAGTAAAGSR